RRLVRVTTLPRGCDQRRRLPPHRRSVVHRRTVFRRHTPSFPRKRESSVAARLADVVAGLADCREISSHGQITPCLETSAFSTFTSWRHVATERFMSA
ncbi:MAG TPA: hypothetical protein VIL19_10625, partial [Casimicrobiaceae bacterium]